MKNRRFRWTGHGGLGGIITITLVYLGVIILILIFVNQMMTDTAGGRNFQYFVLIPLVLVLPFVLLGLVVFNIVQLVKQNRQGKSGARFRTKLTIFFSLVALLSSLPQSILSISIVGTTMNSWFSSYLEDALRGGVELAVDYYQDSLETLRAFTESELAVSLLTSYASSPQRLWQFLSDANPWMDSFQVFSDTRGERFFGGQESARLAEMPRGADWTGVLPRDNVEGISFIRGAVRYTAGGESYLAVFSSRLPAGFEAAAHNLSRALSSFTQYRVFQGSFLSAFALFYFLFSFPLLLISILIAFILSQEIIQPLVNLEEATKKVAEGDFSFRILYRSKDDLEVLIRSFNLMVSELEQSQKQLLQTDKIAAWQEIAQRLAHEIKNPLTPIKLSAQRILRRFEAGPENLEEVLRQGVDSIIAEVDGLSRLLEEFRDFSRLPAPNIRPGDLSALIGEVLGTYRDQHPLVEVDTSRLDPVRIIPMDEGQIKRVFSNLLKNAFESISGPGAVSLAYDLVRKGNTNYLRIRIQDTGVGIPREVQSQVFNPYYTTKSGGTGLGLPIVERIIFDHKGRIWFESEVGIGTTFFIDLPLGDSN